MQPASPTWSLLRPDLLALVPLAALAVVAAFAVWARRRGRASKQLLALRIAAVALLCVALADPRHVEKAPAELPSKVMIAVDCSASIASDPQAAVAACQTALGKRAKDSRVLAFAGGTAAVDDPTDGGAWRHAQLKLAPGASRTDLAGALDQARTELADARGSIVLLSDGRPTEGDLERAIKGLRHAGVPVHTVPLAVKKLAGVSVQHVSSPAEVLANEEFEVEADLASTVAGTVRLSLVRLSLAQGRVVTTPLKAATLNLKPGVTHWSATHVEKEGGTFHYVVWVDPAGIDDPIAEDNRGSSMTRVFSDAKVLVATLRHRSLIGDALVGKGWSVDVVPPEKVPWDPKDLRRYGAVVLENVPARAFQKQQQLALHDYVRDESGGLLMTGATNGFAPGGWQGTPVDKALPVETLMGKDGLRAPLAMVVVIDTSGSMGTRGPDGRMKLELAAEAAGRVCSALKTGDIFGVIGCDTIVDWVVPLGPLPADRTEMLTTIAGMRVGGGGIYCHLALDGAVRAIKEVQPPQRHVILMVDTADAEEKVSMRTGEHCNVLAQRALRDKTSISVVGVGWNNGHNPDIPFCTELARAGHGRFVWTANANELPELLQKETEDEESMCAVVQEGQMQPVITGAGQALRAFKPEEIPTQTGYVRCRQKALASSALVSTSGDPVLSTWRYGLGKAAAFTSDVGPAWGNAWLSWPQTGRFWKRVVRELESDRARDYTIRTNVRGLLAEITVDAVDAQGKTLEGLSLTCHVAAQGGAVDRTLRQVEPGRYRCTVDLPDAEPRSVEVVRAGGVVASAILVPGLSPEFLFPPPDRSLLASIATSTGGRALSSPAELEATAEPPAETSAARGQSYSTPFVLLALALFLTEVVLRQLWSGGEEGEQQAGNDQAKLAARFLEQAKEYASARNSAAAAQSFLQAYSCYVKAGMKAEAAQVWERYRRLEQGVE